jgi:hypothetical protein
VNIKPGGTYNKHWALMGQIPDIKTTQLITYRNIIAVCSHIHTEHITILCGQNVELVNVEPGGTYTHHCSLKGQISLIKTSRLLLYREIIAVYSQIDTKHINTV